METWRHAWRNGFASQLSVKALEALREALMSDDPNLIQGSTTVPAPLQCTQDWPVEAACLIGYCGWQGEGLETVAEVEGFFAEACFQADQCLGGLAASRWLLNWFDETPREEMRRLLLEEVSLSLSLKSKEDQHATSEKPSGDGDAIDSGN